QVKLAYWFIDPKDVVANRLASLHHGVLVDCKLTYMVDIATSQEFFIEDSHLEDYLETEPSNELIELSLQSGEYSRYKVDTHFAPTIFRELYITWITKSVKKVLARAVMIYRNDEQNIAGMMTLEEKKNNGSIGLIAVDSQYRQQSIGKKLILTALDRFQSWQLSKAQVVTQKANQNACRLYEQCGFRLTTSENVYHFWL
ncbi:MAG: hypothetical protein BWK79_09745, partial [Beggiatoa sp. IS2]